MTFADLAQKILNEATPDPRGLRTSSVGRSDFNPQLPSASKKRLPTDRPGSGGSTTTRTIRNIFRLLKNDSAFFGEINEILKKYAQRQQVSYEYETDIVNLIQQVQDGEDDLLAYKKAYQEHQLGRGTLESPEKIKGKIKALESYVKGSQEELNDILKTIEKFPKENEDMEFTLRNKLVKAVKGAASRLLKELETPAAKASEVKSLDQLEQLVTTDEELQQNSTKQAVLDSLTKDTAKDNVLLRYFQNEENKYQDFMKGRSLSGELATIEQNKQFNMLPLSAFARFYNSSVKDASSIKLLPTTAGAKALQGGFAGSQAGRKAVDKSLIDLRKLIDRNFDSKDAGVERRAFGIIDTSSASPEKKDKLKQAVTQVLNGQTPPSTLANIIYNESIFGFDILVEDLLTEAKKGARCTKVTGQQASSRPSKKYMRCAKVDGKLKRVHYGDPNLRIKKSNPKKRKSFRARHKCSTAKPGSAKYFSCKNWNIIGFLAPAGLLLNSLCDYLPL